MKITSGRTALVLIAGMLSSAGCGDAGQSLTLKARVVAPRHKPEFAQVLTYYTDSPESPKLAVRIRAIVSAPSS